MSSCTPVAHGHMRLGRAMLPSIAYRPTSCRNYLLHTIALSYIWPGFRGGCLCRTFRSCKCLCTPSASHAATHACRRTQSCASRIHSERTCMQTHAHTRSTRARSALDGAAELREPARHLPLGECSMRRDRLMQVAALGEVHQDLSQHVVLGCRPLKVLLPAVLCCNRRCPPEKSRCAASQLVARCRYGLHGVATCSTVLPRACSFEPSRK